MTNRRPLTEGNTRNVQKGNVARPSSQQNVRPTGPPPAPTPAPPQSTTNTTGNTTNNNSSGGQD